MKPQERAVYVLDASVVLKWYTKDRERITIMPSKSEKTLK